MAENVTQGTQDLTITRGIPGTQGSTGQLTPAFPFQRLAVYVAARELAAVVHLSQMADAELRDQATRASKSVVLNLAEGLGSESPGVRRRHFGIAAGSVFEVAAAVDLAVAVGVLAPAVGERALALALSVKRMLRGLVR